MACRVERLVGDVQYQNETLNHPFQSEMFGTAQTSHWLMNSLIPYGLWITFLAWGACFLYIKIHLQAYNLDKDYMLRHHFSLWSEFPEIIRTEENGYRKRKFSLVYRCHNIAGVLFLLFLLLCLWMGR